MDLGVGVAGAVGGEEPTDAYSVELHEDPSGAGCIGMTGEAHLLQQFPHRFHQVVHGLEVRAAAVQDACAGRGRSGETRSRVGTQAV